MFTFLPQEFKKEAVREYHLRLIAIYLAFAFVFFTLGAALALPTFALMKAEKTAATTEREIVIKNLKESPATLEKEVKNLNEKISLVTSSSDAHGVISVLERILAQTGNGITVQSLSLKRGDVKTASIGGIASSRDSLVAFSKRLQGEPSFSHADIPVGSFAKNKDIPFNISVTTSF